MLIYEDTQKLKVKTWENIYINTNQKKVDIRRRQKIMLEIKSDIFY